MLITQSVDTFVISFRKLRLKQNIINKIIVWSLFIKFIIL